MNAKEILNILEKLSYNNKVKFPYAIIGKDRRPLQIFDIDFLKKQFDELKMAFGDKFHATIFMGNGKKIVY